MGYGTVGRLVGDNGYPRGVGSLGERGARPNSWQRVTVGLKAVGTLTDHAQRNVMIHWKWAEMGKHGGMVVSKTPAMMTVHWERDSNGCKAQWWVGNQCVRTVTPARA